MQGKKKMRHRVPGEKKTGRSRKRIKGVPKEYVDEWSSRARR